MALNREQMIEYGKELSSLNEQTQHAKVLFTAGELNLDQYTEVIIFFACGAVRRSDQITNGEFMKAEQKAYAKFKEELGDLASDLRVSLSRADEMVDKLPAEKPDAF